MKIKLLLFIIFFISISGLKAQITYFDTYESQVGTDPTSIPLNKSSSTDGTGRYTFVTGNASNGGCYYRIQFGDTAHPNSWVIEYSLSGPLGPWHAGFYNNNQTTPLPPSLAYGGWVVEPGNLDNNGSANVLTTLNGVAGVDVTNPAAANPPTVITSTTLANITASTATVGGTVTADGGAVLTARGIVYGTSINPTIGGPGAVAQGKTTGTFTVDLSSLTASVTYHYRAYATNSAGTNYGADQFFTTPASPATITGVTSSTANGTYKTGDVISIQVNFSSAVAVTGIPRLQLSTGTTNRQVNYSGTGNGTSTLTFNYTVQDGDNSADLDYLSTTALTLNGGTITNGGTNTTLTLATPGAAGSLGANKNIVIDAQAPTATILVAVGAMKVGETSLVTITFSEAVTGFTNADLTIANGTLAAISTSDGGVTWTATFTPTAGIKNAVNVITLDNTGVADAAGNAGTGSTNSNNYAIDTQRPTATIVVAVAALKAGETSLVTITFSEAVTAFTNADLTIANGTLAAVSSSDGGTTWTAIFTPTAGIKNAVNVITLKNNGVADAAGNAGTGSTNSNNYTIDTQRPTATIVVAVAALKVGETSLVTITFNKAVSGFTNADLTIANGTLAAISTSDGGTTWTATFTPTAGITNAVNVITLDNTGVTDATGNAGTGSTNSNNYAIDTQRPTATIVVAVGAMKVGETSLVTITFSEAVSGFTNADLTIANGTLAAISTSDGGTIWTATFTPTAGIKNAVNVITLDNTGVADAAGNAGTGSTNSNNYAIDTQRPTATIVVAVAALKAGETSLVTITFSEAVTAFTNADLTIANGTLAAVSSSDGGTTWTAIFTPTAGITNAVNVITLKNNGVADAAGNAGTGSTNSNNYTIDTQRPTATIVVAVAALKVGETSLVTITFNKAVSGFTNADLTIDNGSLTAVSSSDGGITWIATFTPTAGITDATNLITLDNTGVSDLAGNAGTGSTPSNNYAIDNQRPTATIVVAVGAMKAGETSLVTITFSEAVTGFTNADLTIANGSLTAVSSNDGGITWIATFTPTPGITDATNLITLDNTGVSDLAGNAGTGSTPSNNYAIDTKAPDATSAPLLSSLSDTGISGDNITSLTTPTFTGTAEPGATITLYDTDGSTVLGTTPADGSGNWSITSSTLTATSHTITAKATDAAGNVSTISSGLNITIDNTVPVAPLLSLPTNNAAILVATPEVKGTAEPGAVVTVNIDGTVVNTGITTDGSGNWTYTASALPNGPHAVKVLATDVSGNASAYSSTIAFTINIDPTITATGTLSALTATYGTAASSTSFTVSGINMTAGILVTPPAGFEVSTDNTTFSNTVTAGAAGVISQIVYVRLKNTAATTYSDNITLSSPGAVNVTEVIPNSSVAPLAIAITADAKSKTYGDADPEFTYKVTTGALVNADTFTGTLTRGTGEDVNTYAITQGTLALSSNYALAYVPANLTIGTRALIITADQKDKLAGAVNPVLTVSYSGFITGENNTVLTVQPSITTTAVTTSPIGTYDIDAVGAAAANYNISYQKGILTIHPAAPTSITLAAADLYENSASGTNAGTLSSTSADPGATFTYTLVPGTGSTDNSLFSISGSKINTTASLDFENKAVYKVRVRSTTQTDQWLEQELSIGLGDVNEIPTLAAISDQTICYTATAQTIALSGISAGPETAQTTALSVSSSNANLFESLTATGNGASGTLRYKVKNGASGMATVTITVTDNGSTVNGGMNTCSRTFAITVNALPVVTISSNKGTRISKGETVILSATGGTNYVWAVNSSILSGQNTAVLTIRPRETTTYTVTVTNAGGCTETRTFTLTVLDDLVTIKATNILTPNNDGYNDKWVVDNIDFYPNNEVKIFDKSGRSLYSKKGYDNSWDGTFNGIPLAEGTYYYIIDFGTGRAKFKGFITIARQD